MTTEERARIFVAELYLEDRIEGVIDAAIEEDRESRPHVFAGRLDRDCEDCGKPERDSIHLVSQERLKKEIEMEREACAFMVQAIYERELKEFANYKQHTDAPHCILEDLMNAIRARSEHEEGGKPQ